MDDDDDVIRSFADQLKSPFEDEGQYRDFMMRELPELQEPVTGFATTQTPGPAHAHPQLNSPSISPPGHQALIPATAGLVFDRNDKKEFLQNVKGVTEKRDKCTYDHLLKQYQCLAHAVLKFRNITPLIRLQSKRRGAKRICISTRSHSALTSSRYAKLT
jgi:hypothetical protein